MHAPSLELTLCDFRGRALDAMPHFVEASASWIGGAGEGALDITLPRTYDTRLLKIGRWISAWVRYPGSPPHHINTYLVRRIEMSARGPERVIRLRALAPTHILSWRLIQSPSLYENQNNSTMFMTIGGRASSTGAFAKEGCADDVMRAYVREQCTSQAASAIERSFEAYYNLSVEADRSILPKQTKSAIWSNLLETLKAIAKSSREDSGRPFWTDFELVVNGHDDDFGLQFRVFVGQRGRYLGLRSPSPLVLTPQHFTDWTLLDDHESEATAIYIDGARRGSLTYGETRAAATSMDTYYFVDPARRAAFPANFIEKKYSLAQTTVQEAFRHEGMRYLGQHAPLRRIIASVEATGPLRFMRDIQFGDVVVGQVGSRLEEWRLQALEFTQSQGQLSIRPRFEIVDRLADELRLPGSY